MSSESEYEHQSFWKDNIPIGEGIWKWIVPMPQEDIGALNAIHDKLAWEFLNK